MALEHRRHRLDPRLAEVLGRLSSTSSGEAMAQHLVDRVGRLAAETGPSPTGSALTEALRAFQWLLDHAADGGLPLTAAGYLRPVDVVALAEVLPTMESWPFAVSREVDVRPVHGFRRAAQAAGLLRKYRGDLLLTKLGQRVRSDQAALWEHLRDRLVPQQPFAESVAVVVLVQAATSDDEAGPTQRVAEVATRLGWAHEGGRPVLHGDVSPVWNDLWSVLGNVGPWEGASVIERRLSSAAKCLIRDALLTEAPL